LVKAYIPVQKLLTLRHLAFYKVV